MVQKYLSVKTTRLLWFSKHVNLMSTCVLDNNNLDETLCESETKRGRKLTPVHKHHAMKITGGVKLEVHAFLTRH
jgi:hypothetical protein